MEQYYIQREASGYVGNCLLWWRRGHNGYTCDISEAQVFDDNDPKFIDAMNDSKYRAWKKESVDSAASFARRSSKVELERFFRRWEMKTRNGFVSNSSSSSFIVRDINYFRLKKETRLNKSTISKLIKRGFKETWVAHPSRLLEIERREDTWKPILDADGNIAGRNFGLFVSCNQDDEIEFLVKEQISFIASIHYGHATYVYHKGDDHIMYFENFGQQVETYYCTDCYENIMKSMGSDSPYGKLMLRDILIPKDLKTVLAKIRKNKEKKKNENKKRVRK